MSTLLLEDSLKNTIALIVNARFNLEQIPRPEKKLALNECNLHAELERTGLDGGASMLALCAIHTCLVIDLCIKYLGDQPGRKSALTLDTQKERATTALIYASLNVGARSERESDVFTRALSDIPGQIDDGHFMFAFEHLFEIKALLGMSDFDFVNGLIAQTVKDEATDFFSPHNKMVISVTSDNVHALCRTLTTDAPTNPETADILFAYYRNGLLTQGHNA